MTTPLLRKEMSVAFSIQLTFRRMSVCASQFKFSAVFPSFKSTADPCLVYFHIYEMCSVMDLGESFNVVILNFKLPIPVVHVLLSAHKTLTTNVVTALFSRCLNCISGKTLFILDCHYSSEQQFRRDTFADTGQFCYS